LVFYEHLIQQCIVFHNKSEFNMFKLYNLYNIGVDVCIQRTKVQKNIGFTTDKIAEMIKKNLWVLILL